MSNIIKQNITKLMREKGFNMKSLSLAAGLNETAVRDILKRTKNPSYESIDKIAKILGIKHQDLNSYSIPSLNHSYHISTSLNVSSIVKSKGADNITVSNSNSNAYNNINKNSNDNGKCSGQNCVCVSVGKKHIQLNARESLFIRLCDMIGNSDKIKTQNASNLRQKNIQSDVLDYPYDNVFSLNKYRSKKLKKSMRNLTRLDDANMNYIENRIIDTVETNNSHSIDISSVTAELKELFVEEIAKKETSLIFETDYNEYILNVCPEYLTIILYYFISISAKCSYRGNLIKCSIREDTSSVKITISDNGFKYNKELFDNINRSRNVNIINTPLLFDEYFMNKLIELFNGKITRNVNSVIEGSEDECEKGNEVVVTFPAYSISNMVGYR